MFETITNDYVDEFIETYKKNNSEITKLNNSLFQMDEETLWCNKLLYVSERKRVLYQNTDSLLSNLKSVTPSFPNDTIAGALFKLLSTLFFEGYDDIALTEFLVPRLLKYYELRHHAEHQVLLYYIRAFETMIFYGETQKEDYIKKAATDYQNVIKYAKNYGEIKDPKIRKFFFIAIDQLISKISILYKPLRKRIFDLYDGAISLWNSSLVQALDGDNDDFIKQIKKIKRDLLVVASFAEELTIEEQQRFIEITKKSEDDPTDTSGLLYRAQIKMMMLENKFDPDSCIKNIDLYLSDLPQLTFEETNKNIMFYIFMDEHNTFLTALQILKEYTVSEDIKNSIIANHLMKIMQDHLSLPNSYPKKLVAKLCEEFYIAASEYIDDEILKNKLLENMILTHEVNTYLHCRMLQIICQRITHSLILKHPDYFIGLLGNETIDDIQTNKEQIQNYVMNSALYHDLGKYRIKEIIEDQSHSLSNGELDELKCHTTYSKYYVDNLPFLRPYSPILNGHHKYFCNYGGYPEEYTRADNAEQKMTDLITIADTIESGTDNLLRSYKIGKSFQTILTELKAGKDTQYSTEIVHLFFEDNLLCEDLNQITGPGRMHLYFTVFYGMINTNFSPSEKTEL